jgi:hypothetical protein
MGEEQEMTTRENTTKDVFKILVKILVMAQLKWIKNS